MPTKTIKPDGKETNYQYDKYNRLASILYPGGDKVDYEYDNLNRKTSMADSYGTTNYSYDGADEKKIWYMVEEYMVFYEMCKDDKYRDVHYVAGTDWAGIKCPKYKEHQRPSERIGELRINLTTKNIGDFMSTFLSEWIISDKVLEILQNNDVKGFDIKPVEICNRKLQYRFWEFVITGKGGDAYSDSGIYLKYYCKYCNLKTYSAYKNGIIVDENNWDGSDIFTITGYPRYILVTEKVKNIIEKNKLTGVRLIPSHELKWPEGVIKP